MRGESCPARKRKEASGRCLGGLLLAEVRLGARPAPPPSVEACVGGLLGCQGGRLGGETNPRACPGVAVGAPVGVCSPPLPEARPPSAGTAPLVPPSLGLKSLVDLLPSASVSRATTRPRVHGGSVLLLRFSPGVGRRPVSRRSPLVWSLSRLFAVLRLRPEGSRVSPFPRRCASLCRVLVGGPAAAPSAREPCRIRRRGRAR